MEVFKGAVLNIKFGPFYVFSGVFSPLPDTTTPWMRLWFLAMPVNSFLVVVIYIIEIASFYSGNAT